MQGLKGLTLKVTSEGGLPARPCTGSARCLRVGRWSPRTSQQDQGPSLSLSGVGQETALFTVQKRALWPQPGPPSARMRSPKGGSRTRGQKHCREAPRCHGTHPAPGQTLRTSNARPRHAKAWPGDSGPSCNRDGPQVCRGHRATKRRVNPRTQILRSQPGKGLRAPPSRASLPALLRGAAGAQEGRGLPWSQSKGRARFPTSVQGHLTLLGTLLGPSLTPVQAKQEVCREGRVAGPSPSLLPSGACAERGQARRHVVYRRRQPGRREAAWAGLGDNFQHPPATVNKKAAASLTSAKLLAKADGPFPTQLPTRSQEGRTEKCCLFILNLKKKSGTQRRAEEEEGREQPGTRVQKGAGAEGTVREPGRAVHLPLGRHQAQYLKREETNVFLASWPLQA